MNHHLRLPALAAGLALAATGLAPGAIVYKQNQNIPIATTMQGTSVNLETAGWANTDDLAEADANFFYGGAGVGNDADTSISVPTWQPIRIATGSFDPIANLTLGATVDATGPYAVGFGGSGDPTPHLGITFTAGESGYIGFSLALDGGGTAYGWMHVTLEANQPGGVIHEWAYETTGGSIIVGAVPEPGSALLALLAFGASLLRRRR